MLGVNDTVLYNQYVLRLHPITALRVSSAKSRASQDVCRLVAQSYRNHSSAHAQLHLKLIAAGRFCPKPASSLLLEHMQVLEFTAAVGWLNGRRGSVFRSNLNISSCPGSDCLEKQKIASLSISFQRAIAAVK